jgi:hydroxyethylthiazole kinase
MSFDAYELLERVRTQQPLVHHLTNWVTIYDCAQVVKMLGASPVMAHAPEEVEELARLAGSLVLNIGTLTADMVEAMKLAAHSARQKGIPVVLDACGAGATRFRDAKCAELLDAGLVSIIKGNASEISRLAGRQVQTKGVDSTAVSGDMAALARELARARNVTVVITGPEDLVADTQAVWRVRNGHEWMSRVVGTGCMAASVIGAFAAVEKDLAKAAAAGLTVYGVAGELAAAKTAAPGAFKLQLLDELYGLDRATLEKRARVERS